jgi:negative regulator of flagellin synthesis FlgM
VKIDNSVKSVGGLPTGDAHARQAKDQPAAPPAAAGAHVELSSLASRLQEMQATLANVPVTDAGRVAEIKQAISEGRFQVDAGKVADGLIESVRQMLASRTGQA